eukprot:gene63643-87051_t
MKAIGSEAFYGTALSEVTIPSTVTEMGSSFMYCVKLTSVTLIEGLPMIGQGAFSSNNALTSVFIPGSVTEIRGNAF